MGQVSRRLENRVCRAIGVVLLAGLGNGACSSQTVPRDGGKEQGAPGQGTGGRGIAGDEAGPAPVQNTAFQQGIVHAICDNVPSCCTAAKRGFDAMRCRQTVIQQFVVPLSDTSLVYDSAAAGRCLSAVTSVARACGAVDVTACNAAFTRDLPPGASCQSSFQCTPGTTGYSVCGQDGRCVQPARGVPGAACSFTCIERDGAFPVCKSVFYGASGASLAACHSENGLACVTAPNGAATCQSMATDCKQNPTGACPTGSSCDITTSQCYVPPPVGAACVSSLCGPTAYCEGGTCVNRKQIGAACATDDACESGKCEYGACVVYSAAAAAWCGAALN